MNGDDQLTRAKKTVDAKLGFYIHLLVYVLVNAGLIAINLSTDSSRLWFQWPLLTTARPTRPPIFKLRPTILSLL
jgi:hypothetical protein